MAVWAIERQNTGPHKQAYLTVKLSKTRVQKDSEILKNWELILKSSVKAPVAARMNEVHCAGLSKFSFQVLGRTGPPRRVHCLAQ